MAWLEVDAKRTLSALPNGSSVADLSAAARNGDPRAKLSLGLMRLLGSGLPKDEKAGFEWLSQAARQGDPAGCYFTGLCHKLGLGTSADAHAAQTWQDRAAIRGYVRSPDVSAETEKAHQAWKANLEVALNSHRHGLNAEAVRMLRANLAACEPGGALTRWHAAATQLALADMAAATKSWSLAYPHHAEALNSGMGALRALEAPPAELILPGYFMELVRIELLKTAGPGQPAERLRLLDRQTELLERQLGREHPYLIGQLLARSQTHAEQGSSEPAERDFQRCIALANLFLRAEPRLIGKLWRARAETLAKMKRGKESLEALSAAFALYDSADLIDEEYVRLKCDLLIARVSHRMSIYADTPPRLDLFRRRDELSTNVTQLRSLADAGEPTACALLSLGLRSGRYRKTFTTELQAGLTEAGLYRAASETAFMMTADSRRASPNETQVRRHADLGNPYAQYALAQLLREKNRPWPGSPLVASAAETEHTQESLSLLEAAAAAGVPEATKAVAELYFHGHYDVTEPRPGLRLPYLNGDQKWVRLIQPTPEDKPLLQARRTPPPFVIRRDKARAALLFQAVFDREHDADAGYYLGLIHAAGALSSFDPKRQDIEFPAIASDAIKAAAFFQLVMRGKTTDPELSARAESELIKLRLSPEDYEEARSLADRLIVQRQRR